MMLKQQLGRNIRFLRKNQNLTQEKFAELIGIDPNNISKIENGKNYPTAETLTLIAKSLNVEFYELFLFENKPPYEEMKTEIIQSLNNNKNIIYTKC